jgi:biotin carboxylase
LDKNSQPCSGKRLLLLGGLRYQIPVINKARELGCYVISGDIYPDNIAHRYSDEYRNINIIDNNEVLMAAKDLRVDGIMSFAVDPGVISAAYACERLGLPSVGPYDSVFTLQNKDRFRDFLREHNFNSPMAKSYAKLNAAMEDISSFTMPVMVKPVDSAGSKGVSRIETREDLSKAFKLALSCSRSLKVIIEEYIVSNGTSSDSDSFSLHGDLVFLSLSNQYFDPDAANPYTPDAYIWPSTVSEKNQSSLRGEIQRLLSLLNMGSSVYNIETRVGKDNKAYIMECAPRGGGNRISEVLSLMERIDILESSVFAALGMEDRIHISTQGKTSECWGEIILHSNKNGKFESFNVDDSVIRNVYETDLWVSAGTPITEFVGANAAIGTLILKSDSQAELIDIIISRKDLFKVKVK